MIDAANYCVLVVDDREAQRYAYARMLRADGFKTVEAATGTAGLELAEYVSAVVLDVHLPDLNGLEVCRLLRSKPGTASLPVIQVSAVYVSEQDRNAGERAGADVYLIAPVSPEELIATVRRLLEAREAE